MEIDDEGVVLAVFRGEFDASEWLRQRRVVVEAHYDPADYDGKPMVLDMTECRLPRRNWSEHFTEAARTLRERRPQAFRLAIVVGDDPSAEAGLALFAEYQKLLHHPDSEVRTFRTHASAYAWAATGQEE